MAINVTMIGLLMKEKNDADKLGEDPEQVRDRQTDRQTPADTAVVLENLHKE